MVEAPGVKLKPGTLLAIAWRSFFLQACWNFQGMQNLGFAFAVRPLAKALCHSREEEAAFLKRHLDFFNTHPYCVSLILGVVARTEAEEAEKGTTSDKANRLKAGMMGPLAALGELRAWRSQSC